MRISLALIGFVFSISVHAASKASLKGAAVSASAKDVAPSETKTPHRGLQIKVDRMFNKFRISGAQRGNGSSVLEQNLGVRIGYAIFRPKDLGFIARGGIDAYEADIGAAAMEFLGVYSFNVANYAFAGPKLDYFYGNKADEIVGFGYGLEGGFGARLTSRFGLELSYTYTHHNQKFAVDVDGFVLGATAMF